MHTKQLFGLIQDKDIINMAFQKILAKQGDNIDFEEVQRHEGTNLLFRTTDHGTFNIDYLSVYSLKLDEINFNKQISFFKPLGCYHFGNSLELEFFISYKHHNVAKNQDLFDIPKTVNIHFTSDLLTNVVQTAFSHESILILNTLSSLGLSSDIQTITIENENEELYDFKFQADIDGMQFRYINVKNSGFVQAFLMDEKVPFPVLTLKGNSEFDLFPLLQPYHDKLNELGFIPEHKK